MAFGLTIDGRAHAIDIIRRRPHLIVSVDGRELEVTAAGSASSGRSSIEVEGHAQAFLRVRSGDRQIVRFAGRTFEISRIDPFSRTEGESGLDEVKATMPGRVVAVHKQVGEAVRRGEAVLTIESMKLQMALVAPRDGVLSTRTREAGDSVEKDEVVARLAAGS